MSFLSDLFKPKADPAVIQTARQEGAKMALEAVARAQAQSPWPLNIGGVRQAFLLGNPFSYAIHQAPGVRPGTLAAPQMLRQIADVWDPARACIEHLKREVRRVPFSIVAKEQDDDSASTKRAIREFESWLSINGGICGPGRSYRHFEHAWLEDVLVIGCCAIYCTWTGSRLSDAHVMDATTIRPVLDQYGWPVEEAPYEQWVQGAMVRSFEPDEVIFDGITPSSWQPYFRSPLEWLQAVVLTAMSADEWNRNWLVDGNTPGEVLSMPESWTPTQIKEFKEFWDAMLAQPKERRKMKFVPGGTKIQELSRREQEFSELEMHLIRRTCSVYGVSPVSIGFEGSTYKVAQDGANAQTADVGIAGLLELRADILNTILQRMGLDFLHCVNQTGREEAAKDLTDRLSKATGKAYMTINEARQEAGLDPIDGGDDLIPPQEEAGAVPPGKTPKAGFGTEEPEEPDEEERLADLQRWKKKALRLFKAGDSPACSFVSRAISEEEAERILEALEEAESEEDILRAYDPDQARDENGKWAKAGSGTSAPRKHVRSHPHYDPAHSVGDIHPSGYGAFGPEYKQFKHNEAGATAHLKSVKDGVAIAALHHPEIGDIDLPWGAAPGGAGTKKGYGLAKILQKHPDMDGKIQPELLKMKATLSNSRAAYSLESQTHEAGVNLEFKGQKKTWIVTAFKKKP